MKPLHTFIFVLLASVALGVMTTRSVEAATRFSVSPLIIDLTTEARDIINREITLTNHLDRPTRVYASVHEIEVSSDTSVKAFVPSSMSDRATSITSWLEITRGRLELPPRGTLQVPLMIKVHPNAPPGEYHALIGFAAGPNRDEIETKVMSGEAASVILKLTIAENRRELLQVVSFTTDRFTLNENDGTIKILLENTGDIALTPAGEVVVFDTRGKEMAAVPVNSTEQTLLPGQRLQLEEPLPFIPQLGRQKASLSLTYGKNQAAIFDTAFYYSLPWYYLLTIFLILLSILSLTAWFIRRSLGANSDDSAVYDLPMYVSSVKEHPEFDHDLNLKNDTNQTTT